MRSAWLNKRHSSVWRLGAVVLLAAAFVLSAVVTDSGYAANIDMPPVAVNAVGGGSNSTALTWPAGVTVGAAQNSPSAITISGLTGNIVSVTVTLSGVRHNRPDDFDIMVQGPTGAAVLLWSDACGGQDIVAPGITVTFDDAAGAQLLDSTDATTGPCAGGTYRPSNYTGGANDPNDDWGVLPTATTLAAAFVGTNPNGTWSLYVLDDNSGSGGVNAAIAGGWSISITTSNLPPVVDPIADITLPPDSSTTVQIVASDPDGGTLTYQVTTSNSSVADPAVDASGLIDIQTGSAGSATITVTVSDGQGGSVVETFVVTVEEAPPVNQPPVIDAIGDQAMTTGETRNLTLSATDPDSDPVTFGATSGDTGVVTVSVSGSTLTLNAVAAGSAVITVTASDGTNDATPVTFTVTVTDAPPVNQPPVIDAIGDQAMTTGETRNLTLSATDPDSDPVTFGATSGDTGVVTVSVSGSTLTLDAVAAGSAVITVTASDGTNDATPVTFTVTVTEGEVPTPTEVPTEVPTQPAAPVPAAHYAMEPAQLCADPTGLTNPIVRAGVAAGTVPNGNVYCRVLAENGAFPNPLDSARLGNSGLVQYGVIQAVEIFGVTSGGLSYPDFEIPVTVCLEGTGRFIYLNALNAPRTTFEMPSVVQGGFTCATIPAAGTVVLIPALP